MRVAGIEKARRGAKYVVRFDDGDDVLLSRDIIIDFGLRKNDELSDERLREILNAQSYHDAYAAAIRLLNYRMRTVRELRQRLGNKGFSGPIIDRVIDRLAALRLVDDSVFAEAYVADRGASRPLGKKELARRLREKGVSKENISGALSVVGSDERQFELAMTAAGTKIRSLQRFDAEKRREKLIAFLLRRGFEWSIVRKVIQILVKGELDETVF